MSDKTLCSSEERRCVSKIERKKNNNHSNKSLFKNTLQKDKPQFEAISLPGSSNHFVLSRISIALQTGLKRPKAMMT